MSNATPSAPLYDGIGHGYASARRPDARIATRIDAALGDARTVLNVGAGAGSYEPAHRRVVAVEPSALMLSQRPGKAAPAIRGVAEFLPFRDGSFDAVMASLTMHHWSNWRAGVREMQRVTRGRIVVFTFDPLRTREYWLVQEYLPAIADSPTEAFDLAEVAAAIGGRIEIVPVPVDCTDGFLAAYWRRPAMYLDPGRRGAVSAFHSVPPEQLHEGIARLETDIASGEWERRHGAGLPADDFDAGYRLIVRD